MSLLWRRQAQNKPGAAFNRSFALTSVLAAVMLLLGLLPQASEALLQFDRIRIDAGEWWRLITGQLIHYGFYHLAMNLGALLLCSFILLRQLQLGRYSILLALTALSVGLGLYFGNPDLTFYGGFSGVLHGLIMAGLLLNLREAPAFYFVGLLLVSAKLLHEQATGFDPQHPLLPVPVAVDAHLYGALAGLVLAIIFFALDYRKNPPIIS